MRWHFSRKRPSDKTRDPIAGEFFASEAIKNAGEALVREGIQNSLDARPDRANGTASVRIFLSGASGALSPGAIAEWCEGAWPHLLAQGNGLPSGAVTPTTPCQYLVFEDFGTTGLEGDPESFEPVESVENPFFYFFRAEGKTQKSGDDRGRWGIGKQVFPRSSRAQMFFGYTETSDGGLLMGGCVLKNHRVSDQWFKPDGYFGEQRLVDDDALTVPVRDPGTIERFRNTFHLARRAGQRGLSVVVPWLEEGGDDSRTRYSFGRDTLALAVLEGYYLPIIDGRLEVTIEDATGVNKINASTYPDVLRTLLATSTDARVEKAIRRLEEYIVVASVARSGDAQMFTLPPCPEEKATWTDAMLPSSVAQDLRSALDSGNTIAVCATLTVRPKAGERSTDTFRCFLRKVSHFLEKPSHVREDLIISNVDCGKINGFACVIRIENGPLARLLGDSEGPAHTEWQASSRNFKDKYTYGGMTIGFVSEFANELLRRVYAASKALDRSILDDVFFDVREKGVGEGRVRTETTGKKDAEQTPPPEVRPPALPGYRLDRLAEGFVVSSTRNGSLAGMSIRVAAAYETTKGNPFKAYRPADFTFADGSLQLMHHGCTVEFAEPNVILLKVEEQDFSLRATGFDVNRDLIVRALAVKPRREETDPSTADGEA